MIGIRTNEAEISVQVKRLESIMTDNPETAERLRQLIREDLLKARNAVSKAIGNEFDNGDPNQARRAVRRIVYQQILGGNINIFNMKRGTANWSFRQKERAEAGIGSRSGRGGNRRKRSTKTARYQGYEPKARGFILRWVNEGMTKTRPRVINFTENGNRKVDRWNRHPNTGNRGYIAARNFFEPMGDAALNVVSEHLSQIIEEELEKIYANQ